METNEQSFFETSSLIAGRYEVVSRLGSGAMGVVLKVLDRSLDNEQCALKILYPHLVKDQKILALQKEFEEASTKCPKK